jgi:phage terminase Nu1 subunit (DNA packaging protein)
MAKLTEAAAHIDLKERRFRQLIETGVFKRPKSPSGWDLDEVRVTYIRYMREQAAGRVGANPKTDAVAANVRLKTVQADLVNLRYQKETDQVLDRGTVEQTWQGHVLDVRNTILSRIPQQIFFEIPTLSPHDRGLIKEICRRANWDMYLGRGFSVLGTDSGERCGECGGVIPARADNEAMFQRSKHKVYLDEREAVFNSPRYDDATRQKGQSDE